jgi:phosphatidate cytidylyltransferase
VLSTRIITAIVYAGLAIAAIIGGHLWITLFGLVVFGIGSLEFVHMMARRGIRVFGGLILLWLALFFADRLLPEAGLLQPGMALLLILTMVWAQVRFQQGTANTLKGLAMTLTGAFYIGWAGAHLISIRALKDGLFWTFTVMLTVWVVDTSAYFVGSSIGHTRFFPLISPKKTLEGYFGGILFGTLYAVAMTLIWPRIGAGEATLPVHGLAVGGLISIISPLGDIAVSAFKRYAGVKHSSNLLAGHGGFLDRVDSLLWALPLGYYYITLVVR